MARHANERLFAQHCVFRQHAVEIGAEPVGQIFRLDRAAKPARMKAAGNPVTDLDPRHLLADGLDIASAIRKWYYAGLGRTATATFEDHQVAVIERTCPDPHQDFVRPRSRVFGCSPHDPANAAQAVYVIGFHLSLLESVAGTKGSAMLNKTLGHAGRTDSASCS